MKRLLLAVTCFVFLSAQTPLARDRFENLQVLGDIPQSQLIGTMAFMAGSLGVKCEFCHVAGDFPSDEKPQKKTARRMIRMAGEINTQFFHGERRVTCQTCHRGSNKPANRPTSEQAFWNVKPAPVVEPPPVAADVLAKYLRALGNDGAPSPFIAKVTTRWINGSGDPTDSSATISFESPERFRLEERDDTSETITIVNGDRASIRTGSEVRDATRAERGDAWRRVSAILPVVPDAASLMAMESERVEGKLAYVLESGSGANRQRFFFDATSGFLIRKQRFIPTAFGEFASNTDFESYQSVAGTRMPQRIVLKSVASSSQTTVTLTAAKRLDPALFER